VFSDPLLNCLLIQTAELDKMRMASAAGLLGLLPTILAFVGSTLYETTLLSVRRPLLAYLLATGSPAVPPLRSFSQEDIPNISKTQQHETAVHSAPIQKSIMAHAAIVIVEIALASAATAIVMYTCYDLGIKSILIWSADVYWHFLLWTSLPGLVHLWEQLF
jgi:hypothetical protein